jgi:cell division protein FtsA
MITVPQIGEDTGKPFQISKAELTHVIRPRLEEIFEQLKERLLFHPSHKLAGRRLVLTGGASQMPGLVDMVCVLMDKQTRLGKPIYLQGLTEASRVAAFSTAAGLLLYGQSQRPAGMPAKDKDEEPSLMNRLGGWLKENFST